MLRVAILGCGAMGRAHAAAYQTAGAEIAGVCDVLWEKARDMAGETGCKAYADLHTMLLEQKPDALSICTPADSHVQAVKTAAECGCAVLCEKPLAWKWTEALEAARAVAEHSIPFRLGFKMRYESVYAEAQRVLASGRLGALRHVFISHFQPLSEPAWYMDVGVATELLIHAFDIACWLFGDLPESVRMESDYNLGLEGEDQARVEMVFSDRRRAVIAGGYMPQYPPIRGMHDFVFQFQGEKGYVAGKRNGGIAVFSPDGIESYEPTACDAFALEMQDFVKAAKGQEAGGATLCDALRAQRVLEAAMLSARVGSPVKIRALPREYAKI